MFNPGEGFGATDHPLLGGRHGQRAAFFSGGGQKNLKFCSLPGPALDLDPALVLLDDAVTRGEAEAGSPLDALGGEKGLEDAGQIFRGYAAAGVGEGEADEAAGGGLRILPGARFINEDGGSLNGEAASAGHGVTRVDGKVPNDLLEHAQVRLDGGQRGGTGDALAG